jgi:hypothetical protein
VLHFIAFVALQASGSAPAVPRILQPEEAGRFVVAGAGKQAEAAARIRGQSDEQVSTALTEALSGKSKLIYQEGHGVFVEYTAPDGQLRMWYPNNQGVVRGSWGIRRIKNKMRACFRYNAAVNPVSGEFEPTECVSAAQTLSEANALKVWPGDVFGLMSDKIPYRKGVMDLPEPGAAGAQAQAGQPGS